MTTSPGWPRPSASRPPRTGLSTSSTSRLDRRFVNRRLSTPNARLIAGIYADSSGRPGSLLGKGQLTSFRPPRLEHGPDHAVELGKGTTYWIAVMLGRGEPIWLKTHGGGVGTSPSVTSPKGQQDLLNDVAQPTAPSRRTARRRCTPPSATACSCSPRTRLPAAAEGAAALRSLADANEVTFDVTDDASKFTEDNLAKYRAVVFLNTSGDVLNDAQQAAFEAYFRGGGGFFGIGSAIETEPDWQFLTDVLGTRATDGQDRGRRPARSRSPTASTTRPRTCPSTGPARTPGTTSTLQRPRAQPRAGHRRRAVDDRGAFEIQPWGGRLEGIDGRHDGRRPPGHLVQGLPGRSLVLHRARATRPPASARSDFRDQLARRHRAGAPAQSDPVYSDCGATVLANYQQTKLSAPPNLSEPIGFDVLPDGRVIQTDRRGGVRLHDPASNQTTRAGRRSPSTPSTRTACTARRSTTTSPTNKWVYLFYSPPTVKDVKLSDGSIVTQTTPPGRPAPEHGADVRDSRLGSLRRLLPAVALQVRRRDRRRRRRTSTWPASRRSCACPNNRGACCHVAGDIDFDKHNNLWLVTGDDTPAGGGNSGGFAPFNDQLTNETPDHRGRRTRPAGRSR